MRHLNLAIFIPHAGCPHRCSFCDQRAISGQTVPVRAEEVERLCRETLERWKGRFPQGAGVGAKAQSEISFFGGSFTAIDRGYMVELLEAARPFVGPEGFGGIRISTRPDAIDREVLTLLKSYGVTSIELGAQSMDDWVLRLNRRGHTAAQVEEASRLIREMDFSLGLQMMTGLYGDTDEGARETARQLAELGPDTVRIYPTVVLKDTELAWLYEGGGYQPPDVEQSLPLCCDLLDFFEGRGIQVIRLGLHPSEELEENMVAGAYHPAFRELCEGERFYRRILALLEGQRDREGALPRTMTLLANAKDLSKAIGQGKRNLRRLEAMGCKAAVLPDEAVEPGSLAIGQTSPRSRAASEG